ncbi:P-loop containing nucleoside triphosphate hydrolase protein [Mucor lusitanicus]|uniref:RNA helicase n=1 Tax=Mucor circinelloides f. lusitanicus TaxID=29924 RepID=A0A8H4BMY1_MUCCL|nr:P-loop containing nucleoside triphosphate hydrolase protein [Mucor lusitanicus]
MLRQTYKSSPSKPKALLKSIADIIHTKKNLPWVQRNLVQKLHKFSRNASARRKSKNLGISNKLHNQVATRFVEEALRENIPRITAKELLSSLEKNDDHTAIDKALESAFLKYAEAFIPEEKLEKFNSLRSISDIRFPSEWFPEARQMKRKIILHVGPTNSGKTYRALKRLEQAESGIYCGPLRLLAHEIFEKMNEKGVACNLLTGEERREVAPFAPLTSSTVEMASLNKTMDVAVIDEIQMIADPDRGWAWTQALLGLQAKEIHLCGEASAVPLVKKICETLDEEVVVNNYERLTPFTVSFETLRNDLSKVTKGDCIVAFSRRDIFNLKEKIEKATGLRCAVAYGALPPETRALQAKAFNDPESGFDVLVASDAVGMGLNLNIRRIIFSTIYKFDGTDFSYISIPQLKQIAGRAGRFNTAYAQGEVTTLKERDIFYVRQAVSAPIIPLEMAGLQPTVDILELFALQLPDEKFSGLLQKFEDLASLNGDYFLCNFKDQKAIADKLEHIKLPLKDRYQFVTAPVNIRTDASMEMIERLAQTFSENKTCTLDDVITLPNTLAPESALENLESSHRNIMLYMWLSLRYPETFTTTTEHSNAVKTRCEVMIDDVLKSTSYAKAKKRGTNKQVRPSKNNQKLAIKH